MADPVGVLRAEISASAAKFSEDMAKIQARLAESEKAFEKFGNRVMNAGNRVSQGLEKSWDRLTTGTGVLTTLMSRLNSVVSGFAWGIIAGAVATLASKFFDLGNNTEKASESLSKTISSLSGLIGKLDPTIQKTDAFAKAIYNLTVAQLQMERTQAFRAVRELNEEIRKGLSIPQKLGLALKSMMESITNPTKEVTNFQRLMGEAIADSAQKAEFLRSQLALLDLLLKANIPTQAEYVESLKKMADAFTAGAKNLNLGAGELTPLTPIVEDPDLEGLTADLDYIREANHRLALAILADDILQADSARTLAEIRMEAYSNSFKAAASFFDGLLAFSKGKSKVLFQLAKVAAISSAIVDTYAAVNKTLAFYGGTPWGYAAAAAVAAAGFANVAHITATSFGGGGGGVSAGGVGIVGTPLLPSGDINDQRVESRGRVIININEFLGIPEAMDRLVELINEAGERDVIVQRARELA